MKRMVLALALLAAPGLAKDSLGVFDNWGAFRDPATPRCYAIARPEESQGTARYNAYASIGYWPKRGVRGQVHFRLSRAINRSSGITLTVAERTFALTGGGGDAWAKDRRMDAAIVAALRSARSMTISATDARGNRIADSYLLKGAATALDAAALGCARIGG